MLDNAYKYEDQIQSKFFDVWYDPKYQYYFGGPYREVYSLPSCTGNGDPWHSFVSVDKDGEVLGLISYKINEDVKSAHCFGAINFSNNKIIFGLDLCQAIEDIFIKFGLNRLEFTVICGNPAEKHYDRLVKRIGGRILCVRKQVAKALDRTICDDKMYEIMRDDYLSFKERNKGANHNNV